MINHHVILNGDENKNLRDELELDFGNSFWTKGSWTMATLGTSSFWIPILHNLMVFEGLMGYYLKNMHEDITRIAPKNRIANGRQIM